MRRAVTTTERRATTIAIVVVAHPPRLAGSRCPDLAEVISEIAPKLELPGRRQFAVGTGAMHLISIATMTVWDVNSDGFRGQSAR
jgi:hypothetical protein